MCYYYLLAWAIVESKNTLTWGYFITKLIAAILQIEIAATISDWHKARINILNI